ncbi:hypothetical protein [Oligella urethralis]|uniref:hypothetical protein n=1 Tax=Oligella urethralis TaxID=90245 RepID=UPI000DFC33DB|nr:hypothetical protein [Oligella urethralis]SUA63900.1 Uncharacterised protein [Oligella urethralis]
MKIDFSRRLMQLTVRHDINNTADLIKKLSDEEFKASDDVDILPGLKAGDSYGAQLRH